jgi:1-pyrroline-5-carboxylate dehydrogenase
MWKSMGNNISNYKSYPRIVGETGGKDFIWAHPTADVPALITSMSRGAFEYQGQKCSAASRAYVPASIWEQVKTGLIRDLSSFKMGTTENFGNFINAVIDEASFDNCKNYIDFVKTSPDAEIVIGGNCDKSVGYFVEPTVILAKTPKFKTMCEEIFGPILTIYVYEDAKWKESLEILNDTSEYALTGAIFSQDRYVIAEATKALTHAAGNFYINDKPTGAVVGQQPFGGGRASGTNDKAGSKMNLLRWTSMRTIKETFNPPVDYRYPFLGE